MKGNKNKGVNLKKMPFLPKITESMKNPFYLKKGKNIQNLIALSLKNKN